MLPNSTNSSKRPTAPELGGCMLLTISLYPLILSFVTTFLHASRYVCSHFCLILSSVQRRFSSPVLFLRFATKAEGSSNTERCQDADSCLSPKSRDGFALGRSATLLVDLHSSRGSLAKECHQRRKATRQHRIRMYLFTLVE